MSEWSFPFNYSGFEVLTANPVGINSSATAHTKYATYTEVIASTTYPIGALLLTDHGMNFSDSDFLLDLAIGSAGNEVVIASNLIGTSRPGGSSAMFYVNKLHYFIPIYIPKGTRISANAQSTYTGANWYSIAFGAFKVGGFLQPAPLSRVVTYGATTASTSGTQIDPGASAGVKGAWVQLTASNTVPIKGFFLGIGNKANTTRTSAVYSLDIGIGAEGSEYVIAADIHLRARDTTDHISPWSLNNFWIPIPIGARIAARALCSINDATDRLFDVVFYGLY